MAKLILTIEEVRKHVSANFAAHFDRIEPYIGNAELMFVNKIIGTAEFNSLTAVYDAANNNLNAVADENVKEAIYICQKISSNLGYLYGVPIINLSIGDTGIQIHSSDTKKTAFQWQIEDLKASFKEIGFNAIEELLSHLEAYPNKFTDYITSDKYTDQKQYLITSAQEFSKYFQINGSRYLFMTLSSLMYRIEKQVIDKLFGKDFTDSLKGSGLSAAQKEIANDYIKPAIALLTAAKSIKEQIFTYNNGVVAFNFSGSTQNLKESQQLLTEKIEPLCESLTIDANHFLQDAQQYIVDNPTDFSAYVAPIAQRRFKHKNDNTKGIFMT